MKFIETTTKADSRELPLSSSFQTPKLFKIGSDIGLKIPALSDEGEITEDELSEVNPIIDKMPIACIIMDNNLRIIHINENGEKMFGYKSQEVYKNDSFGTIFPNTLKDYFFELMHDLQKGHMASNGRSTFISKNKEHIIYDWNALPIHDYQGNFDGVAFLFQNVSDEIQNMTLLEEQGKILEDIATGNDLSEVLNKIARFIEQMSDRILTSILILNPDGRTLRTGAESVWLCYTILPVFAGAVCFPNDLHQKFVQTLSQTPFCS
ncbi:MAG TPA: PAS domain S-box protein, partial [Cytophagaceae bacterium]